MPDPRLRKARSAQGSNGTNTGRYSKMSEEDAASIFENRKRELLNNLLKKNTGKKSPRNANIGTYPKYYK
jgi:hypothetical protein